MCKEIGLYILTYVPKLFYMKYGNDITAIVFKIVEDILLGAEKFMDNISRVFENRFKLGTLVQRHSITRYYGLNILHRVDYTVEIYAKDHLSMLEFFPVSHVLHKQAEDVLNEVENCHSLR